jgi:hypothetical protein
VIIRGMSWAVPGAGGLIRVPPPAETSQRRHPDRQADREQSHEEKARWRSLKIVCHESRWSSDPRSGTQKVPRAGFLPFVSWLLLDANPTILARSRRTPSREDETRCATGSGDSPLGGDRRRTNRPHRRIREKDSRLRARRSPMGKLPTTFTSRADSSLFLPRMSRLRSPG